MTTHDLINIPVWRNHGTTDDPDLHHPDRIRAYCAVSTAGSRASEARYAAVTTPPGSDAWVRALDLRTTLDDRRVAHLLLMSDPARPGETIRECDIERSGPCTVEASTRWAPIRRAAQQRNAARNAAWLGERRRTDPGRLDYVGPLTGGWCEAAQGGHADDGHDRCTGIAPHPNGRRADAQVCACTCHDPARDALAARLPA